MGQYYRFINIDKKEKCDRSQGLLKLKEHSYLENEYCIDILSLLSDKWKGDRVIHVGDYAQGNDGTSTSKLIGKIEKENKVKYSVYEWGEKCKEVSPNKINNNIRYVYNLDRKEYIDLVRQPIQWFCLENNKIYFAKFNSFALLVGCGNEQGGGDYYDINKKRIGLWAGDRLVSSDSLINEYSNFIETRYIFDDTLELSRRIKNINEKTEKQILNAEGTMLKKFLERNSNFNKIDLLKINIDKKGLTENEYKHLNTVLYKFKKKELNKQKIIEKNLKEIQEKQSDINEISM